MGLKWPWHRSQSGFNQFLKKCGYSYYNIEVVKNIYFLNNDKKKTLITKISFIQMSQKSFHSSVDSKFVLLGWNVRASPLLGCRVLLLVLLSRRSEWSGPPQRQSVVLPRLLLSPFCSAYLGVGGRVALAVTGPRELPLAAGGRQQRHKGMNAGGGARDQGGGRSDGNFIMKRSTTRLNTTRRRVVYRAWGSDYIKRC